MVVQSRIAQQRLRHVLARLKAVGGQHITDTAIKALHHPIGLRRSGLGQAVLNVQCPVLRITGQTRAGR